MRSVGDEITTKPVNGLEFVGHGVERCAQVANFIVAGYRNAVIMTPTGEQLCRSGEVADAIRSSFRDNLHQAKRYGGRSSSSDEPVNAEAATDRHRTDGEHHAHQDDDAEPKFERR